MCQRLVLQTQSTSCMACKAFTRTIRRQFVIAYRHPCKGIHEVACIRTPSWKLRRHPVVLMHISTYYYILLRIITYLKKADMYTHYCRYLQYKGCLDTWPLWLASLATITKMGATVGSKSWKLSNTRPELASRNTRAPPLSVCLSNAWYSLLA